MTWGEPFLRGLAGKKKSEIPNQLGRFLVTTPISRADVVQAMKLLIMTPPSWLLPVDRLLPIARRLRRWGGLRGHRESYEAASIGAVLSGYLPPARVDEILESWMDRRVEASLQVLGLLRPLQSWRPVIRWHGLDNVAAALEHRTGAIFWVSEFVYSSLVTKMAFAESGFRFSHLSRLTHGFSVSPFGVRFLNPLWRVVENRYIIERVMLTGENNREAIKLLQARLAANGLVSITVGFEARRTLDVKFLGGVIRVATGPLHLSRESRAPILPVFTVRADDGVYHITITRPLDRGDTCETDYAGAVRAYASMLEPFVLKYPDQWNGWMQLVVPSPSAMRV